MKLCEPDSPYEGEETPPDVEEVNCKLRIVGYMSKRGRATVWDNGDGTYSVVVNSHEVTVFPDFDVAEDYAIGKAFGPQWRM